MLAVIGCRSGWSTAARPAQGGGERARRVGAFALGALAALYETAVLLGGLPAAETLAGIAYIAVYLGFAVALTALAAALARGVVGTALVA
jgi:ABC-2 type transport system permease protein